MPRLWKTLLLCLALAGLPLQGVAAVTMSYCNHGPPDTSAQAPASHAHDGSSHSGHAKSADAKQLCADCTPCHLCGALALPAASPVLLQEVNSVYLTRLTLPPDGHFPDQPKRPPLA